MEGNYATVEKRRPPWFTSPSYQPRPLYGEYTAAQSMQQKWDTESRLVALVLATETFAGSYRCHSCTHKQKACLHVCNMQRANVTNVSRAAT